MVRELQARSDALHGRLLELGNRGISALNSIRSARTSAAFCKMREKQPRE